MAILSPSLDTINNYMVKPTDGESSLLNFLVDTLDDSYEIFFQPWFNGDNFDIVLLKKNCGVIIFEVKDWKLANFIIVDEKTWRIKSNKALKISPLEQVMHYKQNIYSLHINRLLELKIKTPKSFSFVTCALYFHNETKSSLYGFVVNPFKDDHEYRNYLGYFELLGKDTLTPEKFNQIIKRRRFDQINPLFTEDLYVSFKRYLQPTWHQLEDGIEIIYSPKQEELIVSQNKQQKIRGVAGSGKSMLLARRAINANKRLDTKILILTFNISLRNYLHDKLNEIREKFYWGDFEILHYHEFIKIKANKHGLPTLSISEYSNTNLFESVKDKIQRYNAIFIDEVQDYEVEWLEIIKKYFLVDRVKSEYVVFADEKQNIYDRKLDSNRKPYTGVPGSNWNEIKESFRLSSSITKLANLFQGYFFKNKYDIEKITCVQLGLPFDEAHQIKKYIYMKSNHKILDYYAELRDILVDNNIHPNNVCILSTTVSELRKLDYLIRKKSNEKTMTMFESLEIYYHKLLETLNKSKKYTDIYNKIWKLFSGNSSDLITYLCYREIQDIKAEVYLEIKNKFILDEIEFENTLKIIDSTKQKNELDHFSDSIKEIRRNKKFHFWMNPGTAKLSTIHSFKGWEIHTLVLVIKETDDHPILDVETKEFLSDELIYTALTRCRYNLIVFNQGVEKYHKFFSSHFN